MTNWKNNVSVNKKVPAERTAGTLYINLIAYEKAIAKTY